MRGITVTLYTVKKIGTDIAGEPIYKDTAVNVENVLVSPASETEILAANDLYGRKAVYTLAIPKGDSNDWENRRVDFFGKSFRAFGIPSEGIDHLIPLSWNKKVTVERYE